MTFEQYVNQPDPIKNPFVKISLSDCHVVYNVPGGREVGIIMLRRHYVYFVPTGDHQLYTMDGDGNKMKRSVFVLDKL